MCWKNEKEFKSVIMYQLSLQVNEEKKFYKIVVALYDYTLNIAVAIPVDTKYVLELADEARKLERKGYREAAGEEADLAAQKSLEDITKDAIR